MVQFVLGFISFVVLALFFCFIYVFLRRYEKKNILSEIIVSVIVVQIFKWSFIDITRVPSSSMEGTLIPGDFVLISKMHYGPRTPSTLLQIPLTHQTTKFFEFKSYLDWIQIPFFRFPGFTKIKANDTVVFNTPSEGKIPMDVRLLYVKRCIGLPGDSIKMIKGGYYINDKRVQDAPFKTYEFILRSNVKLHKNWFKLYNIEDYVYLGENSNNNSTYIIKIFAKYNIAETLKKIVEDTYVNSIELNKYKPNEYTFVSKFDGYVDIVNWGGTNGILIPKKGLKMRLTAANIDRYWKYIKAECNDSIEKKANYEVYLNGVKIYEYVFKYDYYFMIGDNIFNSFDSRFWGFVREDEIYAKPLITIFSKSRETTLGGLKGRFLKGMWG